MVGIEKQICNRLYKLRNYINFRVVNKTVVDDIYSIAILKLWRIIKNGGFKKGHSIDSYMWLCAKSTISDYFKKEKNEQNRDDEYTYSCNAITKSPEKEYEAKEENKLFMEKARRELSDDYRKVLILLLFQNMNHYEIADTLGISRNTVSCHLMRMRKKLGNVYLNKYREFNKEVCDGTQNG